MLDLFSLYPPSILLFWSSFASVNTGLDPWREGRLLAQNLNCQSGHRIVHVLSGHRPARTPRCLDQFVSGGPDQVVIGLRSGRCHENVRSRRLNEVSAGRSSRKALAYGASIRPVLVLILQYLSNVLMVIVQIWELLLYKHSRYSVPTLELYQISVFIGSPSRYYSSRAYLIYTMCVYSLMPDVISLPCQGEPDIHSTQTSGQKH
jgi:hypothetical protein